MQAIVTKYLGPTCYKNARVKATCNAKSVTFYWQDDLNVEENHEYAAKMLAAELGWPCKWISGTLPKSSDFVHVSKGKLK